MSGRSFVRVLMLLLLPVFLFTACAGVDGNNFEEPRFATSNGAIEGFVLDLATQPPSPVVSATVLTVPVGGVVKTNSAGFYRIDPIVGGTYDVKASKGVGQHASVKVQVLPGQVTRADINFNPAPLNIGREIFFLTDTGTGGSIAHINADGVYEPGQFDRIDTPGLGGAFRSLKSNKVNPNELLVLSNFEHQENLEIFDVYLLRLAGFNATVTRLTNDSNPKDSADFSPDGNQIVLSQDSDNNGRFEIWVLNRDGFNPRQIVPDIEDRTGALFDNRGPAWSRESTAIAFTSRRVDVGALFQERDFDILTTVFSQTPQEPIPQPTAQPPRIPIVPLTKDALDDFTPAWADRDLTIFYAKGVTARRQIHSAAGDDGGSPETRLTDSAFENYAPVQSNDRKLLAWVSTDDFDGSNPDHSPEITVAEPIGAFLRNIKHITRTPPNPPFIYDSIAWRLR